MAVESLATRNRGELQRTSRVHELAHQAKSIVQVLRAAAEGGVQPPDDAVAGACWVAENLLSEIGALAGEASR